MSARSLKAQGFTLVEILIVVVILGILAAIVIPQFTSASEAAKASSIQTQLQSLRSQLELYQIQHNGDYPTAGNAAGDFWDQLTESTDVAGDLATTGTTYGPYLQKVIVNPFTDSSLIETSTANPLPTTGATLTNGFLYNESTGEIKAIIAGDDIADVNLDVEDGDIVVDALPSS